MENEQKKGPKFIRYMQPVVDALIKLGGSGRPSEVKELIIESLSVSDDEQTAQISSGASRFSKNVDWARFYLAKADYIDSSRRGVWSLTEKGRSITLTHEQAFNLFTDIHKIYSQEKRKQKEKAQGVLDVDNGENNTSLDEENLDHREILMNIMLSLPASGFERLCQRLLRESGFEKVTVTGRSGDGGIDGIGVLQVNPFVSFKVLFQSKRYSGSVVVSQVRDFRGAMAGRADKGIIITTGAFTADARKESIRDGVPPIELVDGDKLLDLFEHLELGLEARKAYDVDTSFFDEFM